MIEIQRPEQFTRAAERAKAERMKVRRHGRNIVEVTNESKGHTYHVLFERRLGKVFGTCSCEAGMPTGGGTGCRWSASTFMRLSCSSVLYGGWRVLITARGRESEATEARSH
jgi:hypothetical protein